jgi:hypothetical protein
MKKLITVGFICFVLGGLAGSYFSPNRYKLQDTSVLIDTLAGRVWRYDHTDHELHVCYVE